MARARFGWVRWVLGILAILVAGVVAAVGVYLGRERRAEFPRETHSPAERMTLPRLAAAHAAVKEIQARRRELPRVEGWEDVRAILHAHAEDASHTGGTRPEMLTAAKRAGVRVILLSDHFRPPRDFMDSWRGMREGVLFIPGSEIRGCLIHPVRSIMGKMDAPMGEFLAAAGAEGGLAFLSHIEERPDHSMEGLAGLEIYNRHADAKKDLRGLLVLASRLTDPAEVVKLQEAVAKYPAEFLAGQIRYAEDYLEKWDRETATRRLTGVAANDCHHNQVFVVRMVDESTVLLGTVVDKEESMRRLTATLRPGIRQMTAGRKAGDELVRLDADPYEVSFLNSSTHLWLRTVDEAAVREALREGRAYVSHDWLCDPTGFWFEWVRRGGLGGSDERLAVSGEEAGFEPGTVLRARFPVSCLYRLIRSGEVEAEGEGDEMKVRVSGPGVYRVEAFLTVDGEERPWIYSNPIYVREGGGKRGEGRRK